MHNEGVPEWSNGMGLGPIDLVSTRVQTTSPSFLILISAKDFLDEIIIVDTGSTDETIEEKTTKRNN